MKKTIVSQSGFFNSRRLGAWRLFSSALLVALYGWGVFPCAPAFAQNQNPGASDVFQPRAGEHAAWSGDALSGSTANSVFPQALGEKRTPGGVMAVTTPTASGLVIVPTFDSSITGNPNAAAIQAMINQAVAIYQARFSDPITIKIYFRYSTTQPNGTPMGTSLARSNFVVYPTAWNTFITALRADARTGNDASANASLPGSPLSTNVVPSKCKRPRNRAEHPAGDVRERHCGDWRTLRRHRDAEFQSTVPVQPASQRQQFRRAAFDRARDR